jgi:hypothetical protein
VRLHAAAVLTRATIDIDMADGHACEVREAFTIDTPAAIEVDHRVQSPDGTIVELLGTDGAAPVGAPVARGRTQSIVIPLAAGSHAYTLHYRATFPTGTAFRCPLWIPAVAADGRSRAVELRATIPPAATPSGGAFPAFAWTGRRGSAILKHLPAIVRVPFAPAGQPASGPDIARVMDLVAMGLLVCGMALFAWRRRGK